MSNELDSALDEAMVRAKTYSDKKATLVLAQMIRKRVKATVSERIRAEYRASSEKISETRLENLVLISDEYVDACNDEVRATGEATLAETELTVQLIKAESLK